MIDVAAVIVVAAFWLASLALVAVAVLIATSNDVEREAIDHALAALEHERPRVTRGNELDPWRRVEERLIAYRDRYQRREGS